jgi:hypothetical protein
MGVAPGRDRTNEAGSGGATGPDRRPGGSRPVGVADGRAEPGWRGGSGSIDIVTDTVDTVSDTVDKVSDTVDTVADTVDGVTDTVDQATGGATSPATDVVDQTVQKAKDTIDSTLGHLGL